MKYKKGDRVRIVSKASEGLDWSVKMDTYLGKVMTIEYFNYTDYKMVEDKSEWFWSDDMIAGLAVETPFDFGVWKGKKVCMYCKTREEAEDFCNEMHKAGLKWRSGISYLEQSNSDSFIGFMCYFFNEGVYDNVEYAKDNDYQILEWSDYRSTEPPKEEQEKTVEIKSNDKPLSFTEAMVIKKRMCETVDYKCENCCMAPSTVSCNDFFINYVDEAEARLKQWLVEHPVKTNGQKVNEMLLETFGISYATALAHPDWWQQEYRDISDKIQKENK